MRGLVDETPLPKRQCITPQDEEDKPWLPSDSEEEEPHRAPSTDRDEPWLPSDSEEEDDDTKGSEHERRNDPGKEDPDDTRVDGFSRPRNAIGSQSGNSRTDHTIMIDEGQNTARDDIFTTASGFPRSFNRKLYFHWVIDRHKSWVKPEDQPKGKDRTKQICATFDISDQGDISRNLWSSQWRTGTVSFNRSDKALNFPNEDFTTYPWGLPAQKLYQAVEKRGRFQADTPYEKPFRDLLWRIEEWYFCQTQAEYDTLKILDITEWG
ncbi:hypothetical protein Asppvi_010754 [Aspergillus pseudoviridinutans]|uniref:Uncharacterized protein n=1 Tax=Aspergillus pseudoviridinutans TaxID=1517512 RepID=A0A9P3EXC0_9EURO|nr:uncharacterized protein Asppvi_010754 [Aspergillus pseudoviridinutans]GIJ91781.1 hypothetical protein Asppvi_010754 [Aspergillus pseudoviridinutans]